MSKLLIDCDLLIELEGKNMKSGLYIVTLNNDQPISVNAHDPRHAQRAIRVNKENCQCGKTKDFEARRKTYYRAFGKHHTNFKPVVCLEDINAASRVVMAALDEYRILGKTGRKNKWLQGIKPEKVIKLILSELQAADIEYKSLL